MALKECKECGVKVSTEAVKCPHCGVNRPTTKLGSGTIFAVAVFALILLYYLFSGGQGKHKPPQPPPAPSPVAAQPKPKELSPSEHLEAARKALADGYKPDKNPAKTRWGDVDSARKHLDAIPKDDPIAKEASKLLAEVTRREKEIKRLADRFARDMIARTRQEYAGQLEKNFLTRGIDASVRVSGKESSTITIEYILFSRPMVYKLTTEGDFVQTLRKAGFQKLIFDNNDTQWVYNLAPKDPSPGTKK